MSRIVILIPKDNVAYNFRAELFLKLHELGHEVFIVCPYGKKLEYFRERGIHIIDLPIDRRGTSILNDAKLTKQYIRIIKDTEADLVLTYTTKCSVYGGFACEMTHTPYIVNTAGIMQNGDKLSALEKFILELYRVALRKASCLMYQNDHECELLNGILRHKVHYRRIPGSGVNLEQFPFKPYPEDDDEIIFNFVARIMKGKGIGEYLDCAERVKADYPNARFIIYGDYDDESYRPRIEELEKCGVVEYGGIQLDMKPCIEKAHAVIHPSYYEGMTNVVLEHSAMGRVCIGSDVPGIREGIEEGKTGYLFKVRNVDSMVEKVETFIRLPHEEKAKMGRAAREKMEREFSREIVTNIYLEEIDRILKQ